MYFIINGILIAPGYQGYQGYKLLLINVDKVLVRRMQDWGVGTEGGRVGIDKEKVKGWEGE